MFPAGNSANAILVPSAPVEAYTNSIGASLISRLVAEHLPVNKIEVVNDWLRENPNNHINDPIDIDGRESRLLDFACEQKNHWQFIVFLIRQGADPGLCNVSNKNQALWRRVIDLYDRKTRMDGATLLAREAEVEQMRAALLEVEERAMVEEVLEDDVLQGNIRLYADSLHAARTIADYARAVQDVVGWLSRLDQPYAVAVALCERIFTTTWEDRELVYKGLQKAIREGLREDFKSALKDDVDPEHVKARVLSYCAIIDRMKPHWTPAGRYCMLSSIYVAGGLGHTSYFNPRPSMWGYHRLCLNDALFYEKFKALKASLKGWTPPYMVGDPHDSTEH